MYMYQVRGPMAPPPHGIPPSPCSSPGPPLLWSGMTARPESQASLSVVACSAEQSECSYMPRLAELAWLHDLAISPLLSFSLCLSSVFFSPILCSTLANTAQSPTHNPQGGGRGTIPHGWGEGGGGQWDLVHIYIYIYTRIFIFGKHMPLGGFHNDVATRRRRDRSGIIWPPSHRTHGPNSS